MKRPKLKLIQWIGSSFPWMNLATIHNLPYADVLLYVDAYEKGFLNLNPWERQAAERLAEQFAYLGEYHEAFLKAYETGGKHYGRRQVPQSHTQTAG